MEELNDLQDDLHIVSSQTFKEMQEKKKRVHELIWKNMNFKESILK